jgi:hypothetical protein
MNDGLVSVSLIAGPIHATTTTPHPELGHQLTMNDNFYMHITPDTARQWIGALEKIATEAPKSPESSGISIE